MMTYGEMMKPPTEDELRKRIASVNVLREREACALIADKFRGSEDLAVGDKFAAGYRRACEDIAGEIRAQSTEFKTMDEVLTEESAIATGAARILMEGFEQ